MAANRSINAGKDSGGLVYTTGVGRLCPQCLRAVTACVCKGATKPAHGDGIVRISRETKGRAGKGVTLVSGVPVAAEALEKLATQLKKRCGTGGTVKDNVIEIQGDHRDTLMAELTKLGFKVKRVGG
jgi:translation initiation factor 1